jgi:hypothetical protein
VAHSAGVLLNPFCATRILVQRFCSAAFQGWNSRQFLLRSTLVVNGPSRHFAAAQQTVAIGGKADMNRRSLRRALPRRLYDRASGARERFRRQSVSIGTDQTFQTAAVPYPGIGRDNGILSKVTTATVALLSAKRSAATFTESRITPQYCGL